MKRSAEISDDGRYRWTLDRQWADGPCVWWVMLNPSVADHLTDDPTIRRCIGYAQSWGFGGLRVVNLYPYRATDPKAMVQSEKNGVNIRGNIKGNERGDDELRKVVDAPLVICAWGNFRHDSRVREFFALAKDKPLWCLRRSKSYAPVHPLYQPAKLTPVPFHRCEGLDWRDALKRQPALTGFEIEDLCDEDD